MQLGDGLAGVLADRAHGTTIGQAARDEVERLFGWGRVAERFEAAYDGAADRRR